MSQKLFLVVASIAVGGALSAADAPTHTPEELAVGAVREIISAQAVHKQNVPETGYACSLEPLVEADVLETVWLTGKRLQGYSFDLWCDTRDTPQTTFRASAVPTKRKKGSELTVCTDETNVPRTIAGGVSECFETGSPPGR